MELTVMVSIYNREIDVLDEVEDKSDCEALDVEFVDIAVKNTFDAFD